MRPLLPELGQGHACIAPTLGISQPCFQWHMGFPWSRILPRERQLGAAPLSPQHMGPIPAQQLSETDKHLDTGISAVSTFSYLFGNKLGEAEAEVSRPHCRHPCAPRQKRFPQPLSATNCPSRFPGTQRRGKDHYPFQNEEKIYE